MVQPAAVGPVPEVEEEESSFGRKVHPPCVVCGRARSTFRRTAVRCSCYMDEAKYCGRECQEFDWPRHVWNCPTPRGVRRRAGLAGSAELSNMSS